MNRRNFFARILGIGVAAKVAPALAMSSDPLILHKETTWYPPVPAMLTPGEAVIPLSTLTTVHAVYAPPREAFAYFSTCDDLQRGDWVKLCDDGRVVKGNKYEQCIGVATHMVRSNAMVCVSSLQGLTPDEYAIAAAHNERVAERMSKSSNCSDPAKRYRSFLMTWFCPRCA